MNNEPQISPNSEQLAARCALQIQSLVGCRQSTVLRIDSKTGAAQRIFSSVPNVFPLLGTKQIPTGQWTDLIVVQQVAALFVGAGQIQTTFADHQDILAHGIRSVLNVPIISDGRCVGSINCFFEQELHLSDFEKFPDIISSVVVQSGLADGLKSLN